MSRARRLSIRGIRNFGDEREELIRFTKPLTLIVGQNGVGKTTVIECLRYICTGEFPPGSGGGKGFVHDPMIKKGQAMQVRGAVKAEFYDKEGNTVTVSRTVEAVRTTKGVQFKTVDNTLTKKDKITKVEYTITHRCADVDKEIKASLGLSSAILNNVIFCHQDDANWPLDEGKKLKDRLDEIFDTTRYNKALDLARELIKRQKTALNQMIVEREGLKSGVESLESKELQYSDCMERKEENIEKIVKIATKIEPVKECIAGLKLDEAKIFELEKEKEKKEITKSNIIQRIESLNTSIQDCYIGTKEELLEEIKSYDTALDERKEKSAELASNIKVLATTEDGLTASLADDRIKVGTLQQQMNDQINRIASRKKLLDTVLEKWNFKKLAPDATESDINQAFSLIENNMQELERVLVSMRSEHDRKESLLEKEVDIFRDQRSKISAELQRNEREINETRDNLRKTRAQITHVDSANKLNAIESKLQMVAEHIQQIEAAIEAEALPKRIQDETSQIDHLELEFVKVDELLQRMQKQSSLCGNMETLKSEITVKTQDMNQFEEKHARDLTNLIGRAKMEDCETKLKDSLEEVKQILQKRVNKLREEVTTEQRNITALETSIEHAKKELTAKARQIESDKLKVKKYCQDYKNYDKEVDALAEKLKTLDKKRGMYAFQQAAYNQYIEMFSGPKPCCPLCDRGITEQAKANNIITKLNKELKTLPGDLKQCDNDLSIFRAKQHALLALKTAVENITKFEEIENETMTACILEDEENLQNLKNKIAEIQQSIIEPERQIALCNVLLGDAALYDRNSEEILRMEQNYEILEAQVSDIGVPAGTKLEEVQKEREILKQSIKEKREYLTSLREANDAQIEEQKQAAASHTKWLEERLKIYNEVQKVKQMQDQEKELIKREAVLKNQGQALKQKLIGAEEELDTAARQLEEKKNQNREKLDKERGKLMDFTKHYENLSSIQMLISDFQSSKTETRLAHLEKKISDSEKQLNETKREKAALEKEVAEIKELISCQESKKRNLLDNLEIREQEAALKITSNEIKTIQLQIQNLDMEGLKAKIKANEDKLKNLERDMNILQGIQDELDNRIKLLKADLGQEQYRTIRDRYLKKWIEVTSTDSGINDLQVYVKALDSAMSEYHVERMNCVNKSMKNLWSIIYTGTDTSSIQIRTEATTGTGTRRQFNYKLVQIKHGVEMDMKGRCSAGQRVLASIIIRLALAETFCTQCGMLALDEPTTNLDSRNVASLAEALYNYVKLRAGSEKNFQLIVITHDPQFINQLCQLNNKRKFFELYRNVDGLTSIRHLSADDERVLPNDEDEVTDDEVTEAASQKTNDGKRDHSPTAPAHRKKAKPYNFAL